MHDTEFRLGKAGANLLSPEYQYLQFVLQTPQRPWYLLTDSPLINVTHQQLVKHVYHFLDHS